MPAIQQDDNGNGTVKLQELREALDRNPDSFEVHLELGRYHIEHGDERAALSYLTRAVEIEPNSAEGHNQLGVLLFNRGDLDGAQEHLRKAVALNFEHREAHFNLASVYQRSGRYTDALAHYKEVVLADPEDHQTYFLMGQCAEAAGMTEEAEIFLSEAIRLKPEVPEASLLLSELLLRRDRRAEAEEVLGTLSRFRPDLAEVHMALGLLLKEEGRHGKALGHLREVVLRDDENAEAFNHLGECCVALGMVEQAEPLFAKAIKLEPEFLTAIFNLGKLYYDWERTDEAIMSFEEWLRVKGLERERAWNEEMDESEDAPIYDALARCCVQKRDYDRARELWETALSLDPDRQEIAEELERLPQPLHKRVSLTIED